MRYVFAEYELDTRVYELRHAGQVCRLEPQVFNVLRYLIEHRDRVVTKEELLEQLWPNHYISEVTLNHRVMTARKAIGDSGRAQRYIKTLHGRGYRFIAEVHAVEPAVEFPARGPVISSVPPVPTTMATPAALASGGPQPFVAREAELRHLQECLAAALRGDRQVVLITGEAGIGKTTLVDAFVTQVAPLEPVWIGRGQCLEQHGAGEPYLPLLEALGRWGWGPDGSQLVTVLRQQAPSWLLQLPALVPADDQAALQHWSGGVTRERMLRELAEAVEALTAVRPVVLVLEDLHWSDAATVDWLAYVARRRETARLLVLGTYRPTEALMQGHPVYTIAQELQRQGQGRTLGLEYFSEAAVAAYLTQRFGTPPLPAALVRALHQRTTGNPLFLVAVVDRLVRQGTLRDAATGEEVGEGLEATMGGIPDSLRQLIEQQLVQLAPDVQALLEAASVAGKEFAVAAVAVAVAQAVETVEDHCAPLARQGQFLRLSGTDVWPDGTVAARYGFVHDLYRETLYTRVPVGRQVRWHRQIGHRLETGYGLRARERAAELAEHFVRGHDTERAVQYLAYAGEQAVQRSAHQEALVHLTKGLELLATLPETAARVQQELDLRMALGAASIATKGQGAPEVERIYARTRVLCEQVGETSRLLPTLRGLCLFYRNRGELPTARELGEQLVRLAQREAAATPHLEAHAVLGSTLFYLGDYAAARMHVEQGIALIDPMTQRPQAFHHGEAPAVACFVYAALTLWCLGYPAQAVQRAQDALTLAQELAHPYSLAVVRHLVATLHYRRREAPAAQVQADTLLTLATAQGFPLFMGWGAVWRGWALAMQSQCETGLAQLRQGMEAVLATGQALSRPLHLILLAEAAEQASQVDEGLRLLGEALTAFEASGRRDWLAETYRLQGALRLRQAVPDVTQAEACFQQALALARRQQAKSWELRAATSLSRLWLQQGKHTAAYELLAPIYGWFTEGFDTADLQEAKAVLAALA